MTKSLALLLALGLSTAAAQYAGGTFTLLPYVEARRFAWEERINDKRLLLEIGTRYSFGAISRLWLIPREELFTELELTYITGRADYDGARMEQS